MLLNSMSQWKTILTTNGAEVGEVEIKLMAFFKVMPSFQYFSSLFWSLSHSDLPINHLLFMDDIKLYGRSERDLQFLVHTMRIISTDTGMKFGIDKCMILLIRRGEMIMSRFQMGNTWFEYIKACDFTRSNTPPWVFFTFLKLYKWYQIAPRITYET